MPLDMAIDKKEIDEWVKNKKSELKSTYALYKVIYWYLDEYSCILVKRNRRWFSAAVPKIEEAWRTIETERKSGYEHRASKKRSRSDVVVVENSEDGKIITNMPSSGRICLIKLDHDSDYDVHTDCDNKI
jgi:hypothetical protein